MRPETMGMPEQVIEATLRVIEVGGVKEVTVRKVAEELGRSTTVVTHYFPTREDLLDAALSQSFAQSKEQAMVFIKDGKDALWAFMNWSVSAKHRRVWLQLVAAYLAGLDPHVSKQIDDFIEWWDDQLLKLLKGRVAPGRTAQELCDIIGVVVEGILLSSDRELASGMSSEALLRATISPLLKP
ncbi:MAG: TetR family transcriptional regulator [Actinobacteria bacterium]|nr:TetR family transcriptional regulator [Actinomycetota bacterium]